MCNVKGLRNLYFYGLTSFFLAFSMTAQAHGQLQPPFERLGPYKIGYQETVVIDTTREINQVNKAGEPNGRRMTVSIWHPIDVKTTGVPMRYKLEWERDINPSGSLAPATVKSLAGNLTFNSFYGALVSPLSVLPVDSALPGVNCTVQNCTDGQVIGLSLPKKGGPFPLVVYTHGSTGSAKGGGLVTISEFLASYGYIVASVTHTGSRDLDRFSAVCTATSQRPCNGFYNGTFTDTFFSGQRALDVSATISHLLALNTQTGHLLKGQINAKKIGVIGYSAGAQVAGSVVSGGLVGDSNVNVDVVNISKDPRIKVLVAGGASGILTSPFTQFVDLNNIDIPTLYYQGEADNLERITFSNIEFNLYNIAETKNKYLMTIKNMSHLATHGQEFCTIFQSLLNLQKNVNLTAIDQLVARGLYGFDSNSGLQSQCPASLFYEPTNFAALPGVLTAANMAALLPEAQIPGTVLRGIYIPLDISSEQRPITQKYLLAFLEMHLKGQIIPSALVLNPLTVPFTDPEIALKECVLFPVIGGRCLSSYPGLVDSKPAALTQVVGFSTVQIPNVDSCGTFNGRTCESLAGNVLADALRSQFATDFVIHNSGGIRSPMTCPNANIVGDFCPFNGPSGPPFSITNGQVFSSLPFLTNLVVTFRMSGVELKAWLENGVRFAPSNVGRYPQISGLCFQYDIAQPPLNRVIPASVVRQAADGSCTGPVINLTGTDINEFSTTSINFMTGGGDGYQVIPAGRITLHPNDPAVYLINYLSGSGVIAPQIQGRSKCIDSNGVTAPNCR